MRKYSTFRPQFWIGDTGLKLADLGPRCQLLAIYLFTCPDSTMSGLYNIRLSTIADDLRYEHKPLTSPYEGPLKPCQRPFEGVLEDLRRVCSTGFAKYDEDVSAVWIVEMAHYQVGDVVSPSDNRVKCIIKEWRMMRKCKFYNEFYSKYASDFFLPKPEDDTRKHEGASKGLQRGSRRTVEQEQEQEHNTTLPPSPPPPTVDLFPDPPRPIVEKPNRKAQKKKKPASENPGLSNEEKKWFVEQWQTQYPGTDPAWEHDNLTWIRMYARLKTHPLEEIRRRWLLYLRKTGSYFDGHILKTFLDRDFDKALESANGNGFRSSSKYGGDDNPPGWKPTIYGKPADPDIPLSQQRFE